MTAPRPVTDGATLACSQGSSPAALTAPPTRALKLGNRRLALVTDHTPAAVAPFGACRSPANPSVAAATAAAGGVLTPQPCVPALDAPWQRGPARVRGAGDVTLDEACTCACRWGGVVTVTDVGATGARVG